MEKIIDMVRSEKPIERIRSLEQKIDEVDKIEAIESCVELLKDHIWAVKEVLTTAEASAYLGLSESYLYKLTSSKRIPHYKPNGKLVYFNRRAVRMGDEKPSTNGRADGLHKRRDDMNRKEIDLLLARIEGLKSFLEKNSLEDFQKEILRVDNYLKRFGSLDELLSHLKRVEEVAYTAKEFLTIDEVAYYLQVSKSYVYKLTASREFTVYKPNGKTIFVRRDDLNEWIRRNPCVSGREIESRANLLAYRLEQQQKPRTFKK